MKLNIPKNLFELTLGFALATTLVSCAGNVTSTQNPAIKIDGSSTVYPITKEVLEEFQATKKQ